MDEVRYEGAGAVLEDLKFTIKVGNGGLSFRKRSAMIQVLETIGENPNPEGENEDVFLVRLLIKHKFRIPSAEVQ